MKYKDTKINLPHKTIAKYILNKNQVIKGYRQYDIVILLMIINIYYKTQTYIGIIKRTLGQDYQFSIRKGKNDMSGVFAASETFSLRNFLNLK